MPELAPSPLATPAATPEVSPPALRPAGVDGLGCHAGADTLRAAAAAAGKQAVLERYAADYPRASAAQGPHEQPQSMCPAFGALRVGLRMRRTATLLSGSACCVYGLTFTSHFYGARRSVGYVPFNSEALVTGKLFEDIRDAVHAQADPEQLDALVVINLCVPTASGVPLQLLPKSVRGVRIIGVDVPGFGVPTHAEAKDVLAGAMLRYARSEAEAGPVSAPQGWREKKAGSGLPTVSLLGELFPADPMVIGQLLEPMGLAAGPTVPTREWRELYAALDCQVVAALHPFYTASVREFQAAGRPIIPSAPVGHEGTAAWLQAVGEAAGVASSCIEAAQARWLPLIRQVLARAPIRGRITLSGYEGSELLVARLLVESGAELPYVGTACPPTPWSEPDRAWLAARGVQVQFRATLEQDITALEQHRPDLVIGTTPVVQHAKERAIPALYFTNLISARPLMGPAGAGSLATVVNAALANRSRFAQMREFFEGSGQGDRAGIWQDTPVLPPEFRAETRRRVIKLQQQRKSEALG